MSPDELETFGRNTLRDAIHGERTALGPGWSSLSPAERKSRVRGAVLVMLAAIAYEVAEWDGEI